jgi:hypothetical protein
MKRFGVFLVICLCTAAAQAGTVVWNYAPTNGDAVCCWANYLNGQNFADNFTLPGNSTIIGFNLFTGNFPGYPGAAYNVHLYADNGGVPGSLIESQDVSASSFSYYGNFNGVSVYKAVIPLAPMSVMGGVEYWIGACGISFEAGQLSLQGPGDPGDGQIAQFNGTSFQAIVPIGDQSFQIIATGAAVPEPSSLALFGAGLASLAVTLCRKLGRE